VSYVRVKFFAHVIIRNLPSFFLGCLRLRGLLPTALRLEGSGNDCVECVLEGQLVLGALCVFFDSIWIILSFER
jgi:hypothetical protein